MFQGVENALWARYAGGEGAGVRFVTALLHRRKQPGNPPLPLILPVIIAGIVFTVCVLVVSLALTWVLG